MDDRSSQSNIASQKAIGADGATAHILVDLYWLLRVIEAGSFSAAAEQIGMAKSSLSRRVSQLESRLGVQLINRGPRSFVLTSTGEQVYRHALTMLAAVEAATECAHQAAGLPRGHIHLSLPSILADWLLPTLARFSDTYPQIELNLVTADSTHDLAAQRIDLALSLDSPPDNSLQIVSRPLAVLTFVDVASPSLAGHKRNRQLVTSTEGALPNSLRISNLLMAREAAKAGLGQACIPLCACHAELANGSLRQVGDKRSERTLYAFTQPHRNITLATRTLLDFLATHITTSNLDDVTPISR